MYHNREHAKAAFKHHTLYLNLGWMDNDRQRVINSLYLYSLAPNSDNKCDTSLVGLRKTANC